MPLREPNLPFDGIVLGVLQGDEMATPDGCVIWSDGDGDWIVYAPRMVEAMRAECPCCSAA